MRESLFEVAVVNVGPTEPPRTVGGIAPDKSEWGVAAQRVRSRGCFRRRMFPSDAAHLSRTPLPAVAGGGTGGTSG